MRSYEWLLNDEQASDKVLRDKAFNIANNLKYGHQRGLTSLIYNFFDKKSSAAHAWSKTVATWKKFTGDTVTRACSETLTTQDKSAIESKIISN